jgi:two-component system NtrC family sensor kinase
MSPRENGTTQPGADAAAPSPPARILVIDDEAVICRILSTMLEANGYEVVTAQSGKEALECVRRQRFELAITDLVMPEMDGLQTMTALKAVDPDMEVMVLTGHAGLESAIAALKRGACDYLLKPVNTLQLHAAVNRALELRRLNTSLFLYEASRTLLATLDRRELIPAVLELAQRTMRATATGLALVSSQGAELRVDLSKGHGPFGEEAVRSLAQQAMQAREALRDPSPSAGRSSNKAAGIPVGSVLALPLEVHNVLQGALVVWREEGVAPFTAFELRAARTLAAEITIALDNASLWLELSRKCEELETVNGQVARAEAHARAVIDAAQEAIVLFDRKGVVRDLNPAAARIFGWSREQVVGRNLADFAIPPKLLGVFRKHLEAAFRLERDPSDGFLEVHALRQNGEEFPLEVSTSVIETPQGRLLSTFARDITERKRAEKALHESEAKLQAIFNGVETGIFVIDPETHRIVDANPVALGLVGAPRDQVVGSTCHKFVCPADAGHCPVTDLGQTVDNSERVLLTATGEQRAILKTVRPVIIAGRKQLLESVVDLTARKRAEQALRESEARYRRLFEQNLAGVFRGTLDGHVLDCNDAYARILGYDSRQEILELQKLDYFYDVQEGMAAVDRLRTEGAHNNFEVRLKRRDGTPVWVLSNVTSTKRGENHLPLVEGTLIDITERKRWEEQTRLQTAALQSAANGIVIVDREGHILWVNPAFTSLTGYAAEEVLGRTPRVLKSGEQNAEVYKDLWQTILSGEVWKGELINRRKDGTHYTDETTITPVRDAQGAVSHFVAIKQDVTERKRAERALEERTAYLNTLIEISPVGIAVLDTRDRIQMSNPAFEKLFLYSRQEMQGVDLDDLIVPNELIAESESLTRQCLSGASVHTTSRRRRKDGTPVDVEISGVPLVIDGEPRGLLVLYQDITERKQAEQDLAQERDLLRTLMDNLPDYIYFKDRESRFVRTNLAHVKAFGLNDPSQVVGKADFDFFTAEHAQQAYDDEQEVMRTGTPMMAREEKETWPDGRVTWVSTTKMPFRDTSGAIIGTFGVSHDVTERKRSEDEVYRSRQMLQSILDSVPQRVFWKDRSLTYLGCNRAFALDAGLGDAAEVVGKSDFDLAWKESAELCRADDERVIEQESPKLNFEEPQIRPGGSLLWLRTSKLPLRDREGKVIGVIGTYEDITSQKRSEEALRESEERYRELFENASDLVYTADLDLRLTSLNRVAEQTIGYCREEAAQMNLRQLVEPKEWPRVEQALERLLTGEPPTRLEVAITAKDGRRVMLEVNPRLIYRDGKPVGVQGIARDVTGRDVVEMELRHAQKLESVGRLASGIAHEINTPIQFVGDNTRFLQDSFGGLQTLLNKYQELRDAAASGAVNPELLAAVRRTEGESDCAYLLEEIPKALAQTLDGVTRVATIVRAMKEFAHPETKEMAAADLNKALLSTLTVARNELKYVADIETDFGDLPPVVCNISDLNQVFLNLLVNAAHAIGEVVKGTGKKGKIQVRRASEGQTVLITISDTGCGIPEGIRTKIFDPFFTTKEVGRGTGQGLAIARSVVVERHKGNLTFESEVGKGTTFYIRLPLEPGVFREERKAP